MKIGFITNEGFPSGMATTNRILSLALGLHELKHDITVFCIRPTEKSNNVINSEVSGSHKGIKYVYTPGTVMWPNKRHSKIIVTLKGFFGFFKQLKAWNKGTRFDIVISTTSSILFNCFFTNFLIRQKIIPVLAIDEYPHVVRNKSSYPKWFAKFYLKYFYRFFDGLIIMTNPLMDFYKNHVRNNTPCIHIPMTVEVERFEDVSGPFPISGDYIAYCGNLGQNQKDGVPILIEAFGLIKKNHKDIKLVIIGGTNPSIEEKTFKNLQEFAKIHSVLNDVIFTGKIHRDEMPMYLCNAKILALARPDSIQAQGGFPTKLGEYLSTGKPVVVTRVGEIPDYLIDGENAYLSEKDDVGSFAHKLDFALNNYTMSSMIGKEGRKLAYEIFNYKVQAKKLAQFFSALLK